MAAGHLERLARVKPEGARLHLFPSAGGMATPPVLRNLPLGLAVSGPGGCGAGPAGLEAARALGMRGYRVALAEAGTETLAGRSRSRPGCPVWRPGAGRILSGKVVIFDDDHYCMGGVLAGLPVTSGSEVSLVTPSAHVPEWTRNAPEQAMIHARLAELGVNIVLNRGCL